MHWHSGVSFADDRNVVAREIVAGKQLADLHLDELQKLFVVDLVDFVHEHDDVRYADLTGEQNVLAGLRHRTVRRRYDQDRAVHLRRARDHVLDVVRVARAVNVRIVTLRRLILYVRRVDRDSARFLFRRLVDLVVTHCDCFALLCQRHRDRRGKRRLAVVDVADRADVYMRLRTFEFCFCHCSSPYKIFFDIYPPAEPAMAAGRPLPCRWRRSRCLGFWSGWRESNPYSRLGKPVLCH